MEWIMDCVILIVLRRDFSETNLKCRQCLTETAEMGQDEARIGSFDGEIVCEPPNNNLNKFDGVLTWNGKQYSLDNDKILLRGCMLRNTQWCYGVVIFAGRDTKLMQNSGKTKFKRTSIDRLLNFIILGVHLLHAHCFLFVCLFRPLKHTCSFKFCSARSVRDRKEHETDY